MSERDTGDQPIRVMISPEPTDEEAAAIAAVVAALAAQAWEPELTPIPGEDRWALAGRHAAMRRPLWPVDGDERW